MSVVYNYYGAGILVSEKHVKDGKQMSAIYKYECNFCLKNNIKDSQGEVRPYINNCETLILNLNQLR